MPIAMSKESGSDSEHVKVSSLQDMNDEKPSISIGVDEKVELDTKQSGSTGVKEEQEMKAEEEQDELEEKIEAAIKKFRERTASVKNAAWPFAQKTLNFSNHYPVVFTFLAIFGALSIVPIGFFIGFLLSALVVILSTAVIGICLSTLTCILVGASILFPVLVFTSIISTLILSALISLFLVHRFYLHLRAASSSSGQFHLSVDSVLTAVVDFSIETAATVGIDISPGTLKNPSVSTSHGFKKSTRGAHRPERGQVKWDKDAQEWLDRKEWHDLDLSVPAESLMSGSVDISRSSTLERLAALVAAKEALADLDKNSGRSINTNVDEKAVGNDVEVPIITFEGPQ